MTNHIGSDVHASKFSKLRTGSYIQLKKMMKMKKIIIWIVKKDFKDQITKSKGFFRFFSVLWVSFVCFCFFFFRENI